MKICIRLHGEDETLDIHEAKEKGDYEIVANVSGRTAINQVRNAVKNAMDFAGKEIEIWEEM